MTARESAATDHLHLVRKAARANDLGNYADQIAALIRPSVVLATTRAKRSSIATGASTVGGRPDVPESFDWPTWERQPLTFLAQINLADLAPFPLGLPTDGLLSFFFCFDDGLETVRPQAGGAGQVYYFRGEPLHRRKPPRGTEEHFASCSLRYIAYPSLPPPYGDSAKQLWGLEFLSHDELREAYAEVIDRIDEELGIAGLSTPDGYNYHQLLGYPRPVQHTPIEIRMERARIRPKRSAVETWRLSLWEDFKDFVLCRKPPPLGRTLPDPEPSVPLELARCRDWQSLLMLQEDEHAGIRLVDSGCLYFMYPGEQFRAGEFSDPWTTLEFM